MAEDSLRHNGFSSGLAVLLSDDDPRGVSQNSHLISYCGDIGNQSMERTLEHIFDLPHKSVRPSGSSIDVEFIRSILRNQLPRFQLDPEVDSRKRDGMSIVNHGSGPNIVVIDDASICGDIKILRKPLLVESLAAFSSARANSCVWKRKWMYEVTLETSGVQQLGWATILCPFTDRKGVGDAEDSYAFDGKRVSKWNKEPKSYGQSWVVGDVIGCCIDLDADMISFYRNGESLGVAFDGVRKMEPGLGYYPAISLSEGESCDLNFGARPFKYPIDGFLPIQAPPCSRYFATYLLQCLCRLFEVQCLDNSESAYFEKLRTLKRFAPLKELFSSIAYGICEEFFNLIEESEGCTEYIASDAFVSFLLEVFGAQEPHDYACLDQIIDLFSKFSGSSSLFQHVIVALSCSCKVAPIVLMECPYSGSYPYLALACHILRREDMMVLLWKSPDFGFSLEGFLSRKSPNKQDLHSLIPSVWWPGSSEDIGSESSMVMTMTALSAAINKIEEMQREICTLVIHFIPPVSPPQLPGSVFRTFIQNLILKVRGADHKNPPSGVSSNSILVSLYTVILHFLSEGFSVEDIPGLMKGSRMNAGTDGGFLHRGGKRSFPVELFLKADPNCIRIPRIGGSVNHVLKSHQVNPLETEKVFWDEGCMDDEDARITHSTRQKPCCCSVSDVDVVQTSKDNIRYAPKSSKGTCSPIPERSAHVAAECSVRSLSDEITDKPSSSDQSETDFGYQSLQHLESVPMTDQLSSGTLREEELLDIMLLLYHLAVAPNFRQAFYYMTHQSQSISLLDDTDKQIRERSCIEQVKRLKEARNVYREELVDCVRQCAWYRISLFSRWKQRGMYATCMWVVELLLVLSNTDSIFLYVPEYYVESLVDCFHALRRSDPPFVSSAIFIKHGLAPIITFVVKHFNDPRISSADIKDLLLQSISVLVQYRDYLVAFENNKEAVRRIPRALLLAFDNRSWIPVTNILVKLCKGSGFGSSKHAETSSSALFQVLLREACIHDEVLFSSFLNRLFNTLSWSMTEFSVSIREMQESYQIGDLQQRKCGVVFDLSCSLARILEFCTHEIPQAFILGPDMNLRRLTELVIFILNHIILGADAEFFDLLLRRPGQHQEKSSRTMILAPLVGIILNLMDASADYGNQELNDVVAVFLNMDCPATVHFGFQYLLSYDWVLPLVPPGRKSREDGSPYAGQDANCGNTLLISLEELVKDGLLMKDELPEQMEMEHVEFASVANVKDPIIAKAAERLLQSRGELKKHLDNFRKDPGISGWLEDAALFAAIDHSVDKFSWYGWPEPLKNRHLCALEDIYQNHKDFIDIFIAQQFLFQRQWQRVRRYAKKLGIKIMGDMPIYVGYHSADVWANKKLFLLDRGGFPVLVSGVPPDAFSETGQLWDSPLYDWKAMEDDGFAWWIQRIKRALDLYDEFRIDHFRGFSGFWAVPSESKVAMFGSWKAGPRKTFFDAIFRAVGKINLIAEDLGVITEDVVQLRKAIGAPGMAVLQFAFGSGSDNPHLPHNHEQDQVVYTGTHDNDTILGWWENLEEEEKCNVQNYLWITNETISWALIHAAISSVARTAIIPMQDILGLGSSARMNIPATQLGNWRWRIPSSVSFDGLKPEAEKLRDQLALYNRL